MKKFAFTLAEVLITLGIIGVVAALTMPSLITNYQKKETATKLKHFSSLLRQAFLMRTNDSINGTFQEMNELTPLSPDEMIKYYDIYWKPYLKTVKLEKKEKGIIAELSNGTGAYFIKHPCTSSMLEGCLFIIFCTQYKHCQNIPETNHAINKLLNNTRYTFMLRFDGRPLTDFVGTKAELIEACKTNYYFCATLIERDGWEIKEDYPW